MAIEEGREGEREREREETVESGLRGKDESVICEHRRKGDLEHGGWTIGWFGKRRNVNVLD